MKNLILNISILICSLSAAGQVISSDPALPLADESVIVFFDASGTPLESYNGIVYTHTGLRKNGSTVWSDVIGTWGDNESQPALTSLGDHVYSLEITPSVIEYYGAEDTDDIQQMAFVFRSADAATQTSDLLVDVYASGLQVSITFPDISPHFVDPGEEISIVANANGAEQMLLFVDDVLILTETGNTIAHTITASEQIDVKSIIKVTAQGASEEAVDSVYYYVRGETQIEDLPAGVRDGINYIDDNTVTLVLLAPDKNSVFVHGGFNSWEIGPEYKMKRNTASASDDWARYWLTITNLEAGQEYAFQYIIDEVLFLADPYTDKILDEANDPWIPENVYPGLKEYPQGKTSGIVSVLETGQVEYDWQYDGFNHPKTTDLVVYEMLVRDFTEAHSYAMVVDTLDYLKELGVNVLELMPVNEFEGNSSWGYNPSFYFAPDKYYGPKNELKRLVDECHARDIAVVLDIVLNHSYYQSPLVQMYFSGNKPSPNNPWYNQEHNFANPDAHWGYDFDHSSQYTRNFVDSVNAYWLGEYHMDGFRFDFTKGFSNTWHGNDDPWGSNYDSERKFNLQRMSSEIWERNEDAIIIMEHLAENSEEKVLADFGILLWGNLNYNYSEASMGYHEGGKSDFSGMSYLNRNWNDPHLVGYMESHDEERVMFKNISYGNSNGSYDIKQTGNVLGRIRLVSTFFYTIPGPKMIWQFGELGYDYSIDYNGRLGEKPVRWDYYDDWRRNYTYQLISALIALTTEHDVFETDDFVLNVNGPMKSISLNHESMNVFITGNFDVEAGGIASDFAHPGTWYEYFTGEALEVTDINMVLNLTAGEYRLYTDVQLETPDIGTGSEEYSIQEDTVMIAFPNPVNTAAVLKFDLDRSADLSISVFDVMGMEVINLGEQYFPEGKQQLEINMDSLSSGLYFIRIHSESINNTIKVIKR